jgi:hypothetical protein
MTHMIPFCISGTLVARETLLKISPDVISNRAGGLDFRTTRKRDQRLPV